MIELILKAINGLADIGTRSAEDAAKRKADQLAELHALFVKGEEQARALIAEFKGESDETRDAFERARRRIAGLPEPPDEEDTQP